MDQELTREQLIEQLTCLKARITTLEAVEQERRRLQEELDRVKDLGETLNRIAQMIHSTSAVDEIISELLTQGSTALASETAAVSLREKGAWNVRHVFGMAEEIIGTRMTDAQERHAVLAVTSREPVAVFDAFNDRRFNRQHLRRHNIRSVLVLPLIARNTSFGVLFFNYHSKPHRFSEVEIDFARQLAQITTSALENAQLLEWQKCLAEKLRDNEQRLTLAARSAGLGMFEWNIATNELFFNDQLAQMLGLSTNTFVGFKPFQYSDWAARVHAQDLPRIENEFHRCMTAHIPCVADYRIVWRDGSVRWVAGRGMFEYDENDKPNRFRGTTMDITEAKEGSIALEQTKSMLTEAQKIAKLGCFEYDLVTQTAIWSDEQYRIWGLDKYGPEPTFDFMLSCLHPDDRERVQRIFSTALDAKSDYKVEYRIVRPNGNIRWINDRCRPHFDEQGRLVRYFGTSQDITEYKQLEEKLRQSLDGLEVAVKERTADLIAANAALHNEIKQRVQVEQERVVTDTLYRSVLETTTAGVIIQKATGEIITWNTGAERIFGLSAEKIIGQTSTGRDWLTIREDGSKYPGYDHPSMRTLQTGVPCSDEIMGIYQPSGTLRWVTINTNPLFLPGDKNILGVAIVFSDITNLKEIETSLRQSEERYRELFNNISSGVAIYEVVDDGDDFIFKDFNKAGERLDKERKEDLIGQSIFKVRPGIEQFGLLDVFRRVWVTGKSEYYPATWYEDGRLAKWYENFIYRLPSGELVAVFDDITQRKQSEEALRKSQIFLVEIMESAPDAIFAIDGEYRLLISNRKFQQLLIKIGGYQFKMGESVISSNYPPEIIKMWRAAYDRALHGAEFNLETEITDIQGEYHIFDNSFSPLIDSNGTVIGALIFVHDITRRKKNEKVLQDNERKYRQLFELESDALLLLDAKTLDIIDVNSSAVNLYGYTRDEFIAKREMELAFKQKRNSKSIQEKEAIVQLHWHRKKDETIFPVEITESYFEMADRLVKLTAVRDVTERQRIEEELKEKTEHLSEVNAALRALLRQRDYDRKEFESAVMANMKHLVLPYLHSLKNSRLNDNQLTWIEVLETHLNQLTANFTKQVTLPELNFSNAELKVAALVREGRSTKEIAEILMVSPKTVSGHRDNIRKKLGLRGQKGGLRYLLLNIK